MKTSTSPSVQPATRLPYRRPRRNASPPTLQTYQNWHPTETSEFMGRVFSQVRFEWTRTKALSVLISGTFDKWNSPVSLDFDEESGAYAVEMALPPGRHYYKFIVDGQWWYDILNPNEPDLDGNWNNFVDAIQ